MVSPELPAHWNSISFHTHFRGSILKFEVNSESVAVENVSDVAAEISIAGEHINIVPGGSKQIELERSVTQ